MSDQQIRNAIGLCKGQPMSKIMQLFSMGMWRSPQIEAMSKYFHCANTKEAVAERLQIGF